MSLPIIVTGKRRRRAAAEQRQGDDGQDGDGEPVPTATATASKAYGSRGAYRTRASLRGAHRRARRRGRRGRRSRGLEPRGPQAPTAQRVAAVIEPIIPTSIMTMMDSSPLENTASKSSFNSSFRFQPAGKLSRLGIIRDSSLREYKSGLGVGDGVNLPNVPWPTHPERLDRPTTARNVRRGRVPLDAGRVTSSNGNVG